MKKEGERLKNIRIAKSDLTGNIYLARFGKDPNVAVDKRLLTKDEIQFIKKILG